jgi:S-disulfanyl-L-cysteine oxidoreductase SoxD
MRCSRNLLVLMMIVGPSTVALAQMPTYKLGRTPTQQEIQAWNNDVGVQGQDFPPGSGTAKEGAPIYAQKCASCHGRTGIEGPAHGTAALVGQGTLKGGDVNPNKSIGNYYAFATSLFDYIHRAMPFFKEGSLSANETYALTAFLLHWNGIVKEDDIIDAKTLPKIQMPGRNVFIPPWPPKYKLGEKRLFGQYP